VDSIAPIFQHAAFGPDTIKLMVQAFENCRETIPATMHRAHMEELMAKRIIELARRGMRDPIELCKEAQRTLGISH
jgi:hypothetical protein